MDNYEQSDPNLAGEGRGGNNESNSVDVSSRNQKRYRRTAGEISRKYVCFCGKAYGTENSLNQHKKLKHQHNVEEGSNPQNVNYQVDTFHNFPDFDQGEDMYQENQQEPDVFK